MHVIAGGLVTFTKLFGDFGIVNGTWLKGVDQCNEQLDSLIISGNPKRASPESIFEVTHLLIQLRRPVGTLFGGSILSRSHDCAICLRIDLQMRVW